MGFVAVKSERGTNVVIWPDQSIEISYRGTKMLVSLIGIDGVITVDPLAGGYIKAFDSLGVALGYVHAHE